MRVNNWGDIYKYMSMREKSHKHNYKLLPPRGSHRFLGAVRITWEQERIFVLNPDIWLLIAEGFGKHLQQTGYGMSECLTTWNLS